jgi:hypothetical protein
MKFIRILLIALLMIASGIIVAVNAQSNRSEEKSERTLALASGGSFSVENYKGRIEINTWNQNQVKIDIVKYVSGRDSSRQKWLEEIKVDFNESAGHAGVKVKYPNHNCVVCWDDEIEDSGVELRIQVPRDVSLNIDGYKPDMIINGTQGDLNIKSYKSDMHIQSVKGAVHIDTYKNRIEMKDVDVQGQLYIKTYSGEVDANLSGIGSGATFESYRGEVTLRLPDSVGIDLNYSGARRGSFNSDLPLAMNSTDRDSIRGTINGGGAPLRFDTYRGSLTIRRK